MTVRNKGGRPRKADGAKHVRPSMTWSPEVDELARQLQQRMTDKAGQAISLGAIVSTAIRLMAEAEGLA